MILYRLTDPTHFWLATDSREHKLFPAGTLVGNAGESGFVYFVVDAPGYQRASFNPLSMRRLTPLEVLATCAGDP